MANATSNPNAQFDAGPNNAAGVSRNNPGPNAAGALRRP